MGRENPNSFSSKVKAAIWAARIEVPLGMKKKFIDEVQSVYSKDHDLKDHRSEVTPRVLKNLVTLMWTFGFVAADVRPMLKTHDLHPDRVRDIVSLRQQETTFLAGAHAAAVPAFGALAEALSSTASLQEVDLVEVSSMPSQPGPPQQVATPVRLVRFIEDIRGGEEFQEGSPDAVCKLAERYIDVGALKIAEELLRQAQAQTADHAGLWFQKARLLLAQSGRQGQMATRYRIVEGESEALSAAERHWGYMADEHSGRAADLRQRVFDTCIEALRNLPDKRLYEQASGRWSAGHDSSDDLRRQILITVVREAGYRTDPYSPFGGVEDRVMARFGRLTKFEPMQGHIIDLDECARLAAEPLFSETTDRILISAYDELMEDRSGHIEHIRAQLRLLALNFLRLLAPGRHAAEVAHFVDELRNMSGQAACGFIGPYDGTRTDGQVSWRAVMHEHLDAIMNRAAQRELAIALYQKWILWVERMQVETLESMFVDDARKHFSEGRWGEAYQVACAGEEKGILLQTEGVGAFVLWRTALAAAKAADNAGDESSRQQIVKRHLSNKKMIALAEDVFPDVCENGEGEYVVRNTAFEGDGLDE